MVGRQNWSETTEVRSMFCLADIAMSTSFQAIICHLAVTNNWHTYAGSGKKWTCEYLNVKLYLLKYSLRCATLFIHVCTNFQYSSYYPYCIYGLIWYENLKLHEVSFHLLHYPHDSSICSLSQGRVSALFCTCTHRHSKHCVCWIWYSQYAAEIIVIITLKKLYVPQLSLNGNSLHCAHMFHIVHVCVWHVTHD